MARPPAFVLAAILPLAPAAAGAAEAPPFQRYAACMTLARERPVEAWEEALAWTSLGGGEAARHCAATALIGMGEFQEAGGRLEALAQESRGGPAMRAGMLAQAAQAWMMMRWPERAHAALTAALKLVPDDPDLLIDRAVVLAEAKNYGQAKADLDAVLSRSPGRVEALALRASANRYLDAPAAARLDIESALRLQPDFPDALVERGIQRRLANDLDGARQDWMKAIGIAPESDAADLARANLARMDVK